MGEIIQPQEMSKILKRIIKNKNTIAGKIEENKRYKSYRDANMLEEYEPLTSIVTNKLDDVQNELMLQGNEMVSKLEDQIEKLDSIEQQRYPAITYRTPLTPKKLSKKRKIVEVSPDLYSTPQASTSSTIRSFDLDFELEEINRNILDKFNEQIDYYQINGLPRINDFFKQYDNVGKDATIKGILAINQELLTKQKSMGGKLKSKSLQQDVREKIKSELEFLRKYKKKLDNAIQGLQHLQGSGLVAFAPNLDVNDYINQLYLIVKNMEGGNNSLENKNQALHIIDTLLQLKKLSKNNHAQIHNKIMTL